MEQGGVRARRGLLYQDHVAAGFLVRMLGDEALDAVWCEVEDDVTLIWRRDEGDVAEFIQVKSDTHSWTISDICRRSRTRDARPGPKSLLEKSLAHDRCSELCSFRVVTAWPLEPTLDLLKEALESASRSVGVLAFEKVLAGIVAKAQPENPYMSANGRGPDFWVRNVVWEEAGAQASVDNANHRLFERYLEATGRRLSMDLRDELYGKLLILAEDSASAPVMPDLDLKKTRRLVLIERLDEQIARAGSTQQPPDEALSERLRQAGMVDDLVNAALELRRRYRLRRSSPTYLTDADLQDVELKVLARLHQLLVAWNAGEFDDTPAQFLRRCVEAVEELHVDMPPSVSNEDLLGLLYDITGRRQHRFTRYGRQELLADRAEIGGEAA